MHVSNAQPVYGNQHEIMYLVDKCQKCENVKDKDPNRTEERSESSVKAKKYFENVKTN